MITYSNNNPGSFLGGTWTQFGQGRTLMGQGTGNDGSTSMSFTANSTGGQYKHTMTISELVSHTHTNFTIGGTKVGWTSGVFQQGSLGGVRTSPTENIITGSTGGSTPFNILNPYIVVYFWRRTA